MRNKLFTFHLLYLSIWLSTALLYSNDFFKLSYFVFYMFILIYFIYISINNKLALLFSLSIFIYFYQVPIMDFFPTSEAEAYHYKLNIDMQYEAYSVYNVVLGCLYIILSYINNKIDFDKIITSVKKSYLLDFIFYSASVLSIFLMLFAIYHAGGLSEYLILNKFESSEMQKLSFFTFKDFAVIAIVSGLISDNKKITYLSYILIGLFISFEILSTKRYLILVAAIFIFLLKIKTFKGKYFLYIYLAVALLTIVKFISANIVMYILGKAPLNDIFWFNWLDIIPKLIFIQEGRAHTELLLNYLYRNIDFQPVYALKQLLVSMPFGHMLVDDYMTAGEFLRIHLHEPWSGLASSQYIIPYLSIGFFGITLIYSIHFFILYSFNILIKKKFNIYIKILFLINIPTIFFYSHREEIILILKNLFISSITLLIVYIFSIMLFFLYTVIFKNKKIYTIQGV